jgi:TolB-like protein
LMTGNRAFLLPVVIDDTRDDDEQVPDKFREVQWTRLPGGQTPPAFVERVQRLLSPTARVEQAPLATEAESGADAIRDRPTRAAEVRSKPGWLRPVLLAAVLIVLAGAGYVAIDRFVLSKRAAAALAIGEKSIAVLPFVDLSEKHDQEYFADGMAEEILNLLAKLPELKVIGRTSSFQFKGKTEDLRKVGAALGAAYVVEGSVRRSGDRVRVTAQLIDARDGAHRWSETYDRDAKDVLAVQDEIAGSLVRALQLEIAPSVYSRALPRNNEAYDSYLRGLHARDRYDERGFNEAIAEFRHALELDPAFAPAAEALAEILFDLADWAYVPAETGFEEARTAANAALKLNPQSAVAHTVLGLVHIEYDWDWAAAKREVNAALALAPSNPGVLMCAAEESIALGQWVEAARLTDAAIAADPLDANIYRVLGYSYVRLGRFADAESATRRVLGLSPTNAWGHYFLAQVLWAEGNSGAALPEMQKESVDEGREAGLVVVYQTLHQSQDAEAALARLESSTIRRWPFGLSFAYAALGQNDRAFEWLEKAYAAKDSSLWAIKGHPFFKSLEQDPRYTAFLRKMNLPVE